MFQKTVNYEYEKKKQFKHNNIFNQNSQSEINHSQNTDISYIHDENFSDNCIFILIRSLNILLYLVKHYSIGNNPNRQIKYLVGI